MTLILTHRHITLVLIKKIEVIECNYMCQYWVDVKYSTRLQSEMSVLHR